jgi:hypothetical protein
MDPWVKNPQAAENPGPFAEGDRIRVLWGLTPVEAIIVEDHGHLGVSGKRLYRVRFQPDDITDPIETNYRADELTLVAEAPTRSRNGRQT